MVLNSSYPNSDRAQAIRADIASPYDVTCVCADCLELDEAAVTAIIKGVLYEFPVKELDLFLPPWVDALPYDHPIKSGLYTAIREGAAGMHRIRDVERTVTAIGECDTVSSARITSISLGTGLAAAQLELPRGCSTIRSPSSPASPSTTMVISCSCSPALPTSKRSMTR